MLDMTSIKKNFKSSCKAGCFEEKRASETYTVQCEEIQLSVNVVQSYFCLFPLQTARGTEQTKL